MVIVHANRVFRNEIPILYSTVLTGEIPEPVLRQPEYTLPF